MHKLFLYLFLIYLNTSQAAQLEILILEEEYNEPVLFANIGLYKNAILVGQYESGLNGGVIISNIQQGQYQLRIQYKGYDDFEGTTNVQDVNKNKFVAVMKINHDLTVPIEITQCFKTIEENKISLGPKSIADVISSLPQKKITEIQTKSCEEKAASEYGIYFGHGRCNCAQYYLYKNTEENILKIEKHTTNYEFLLYPNPTLRFINIVSNEIPVTIVLFSLKGNIVKEIFPNDKHIEINISELSDGKYFAKLIYKNHFEVKGFVKI